MTPTFLTYRRILLFSLIGAAGVATWLNWPWLSTRWDSHSHAAQPTPDGPSSKNAKDDTRVELVSDRSDTIHIPKSLLTSSRFAVAPVSDSPAPAPLRLPGTLVLDPNRYVRIHSLFSGHVVKFGLKGDMSKTSERLPNTPERGLRPGDVVQKGQILAVIWSKDIGNMKTDLVNQMSKLRSDKAILDRYEAALKEAPGVVSANALAQARQLYESDSVAVRNAERNLRSAQLTEEEIAIVKREGEKLREPDAPRDEELERTWAEVPLRAPFAGALVEKNVTIGDVVDPSTDIVKLAKLDRLQVLANVYEEDLPKLLQIAREADKAESDATPKGGTDDSPGLESGIRSIGDRIRSWTITYQATASEGAESGSFDRVGVIIDPMQHTGTVTGWVDNSQRRLFVGQFVTATVQLRPDPALVSVPASAVIEGADGPVVFVRSTDNEETFTLQKAAVAVRGREQIFLRREPSADEAKQGAKAIHPGEFVLARGAVEMSGELESLQAEAKK